MIYVQGGKGGATHARRTTSLAHKRTTQHWQCHRASECVTVAPGHWHCDWQASPRPLPVPCPGGHCQCHWHARRVSGTVAVPLHWVTGTVEGCQPTSSSNHTTTTSNASDSEVTGKWHWHCQCHWQWQLGVGTGVGQEETLLVGTRAVASIPAGHSSHMPPARYEWSHSSLSVAWCGHRDPIVSDKYLLWPSNGLGHNGLTTERAAVLFSIPSSPAVQALSFPADTQ